MQQWFVHELWCEIYDLYQRLITKRINLRRKIYYQQNFLGFIFIKSIEVHTSSTKNRDLSLESSFWIIRSTSANCKLFGTSYLICKYIYSKIAINPQLKRYECILFEHRVISFHYRPFWSCSWLNKNGKYIRNRIYRYQF